MSLKDWYELNHLGGSLPNFLLLKKKAKTKGHVILEVKKKSLADVFVRVAYLRVAWGFLLCIFFFG